MQRFPYTTSASIILLASSIMFTGAAFSPREFQGFFLFSMAVAYAISGLLLMWRRETPEKRSSDL